MRAAALIIWLLLTLVVIIFLIDKWLHPGYKHISDSDFNLYTIISCVLAAFFGLGTLIRKAVDAWGNDPG